jgi:predicted nucleic acid-binding Zn ribbon protein
MVRRHGTRRSGRLSALAPALEEYLARTEGRTRVKERLAALVWPECVGDFYAERTEVTRVHRGIMYVCCNSPALAHQLSLDAGEVVRRINAELDGAYVREIRPATTRRGRSAASQELGAPAPRRPTREELASITLSGEQLEIIEAEAALIADDDLRERFRRAAISDRRARKWREAHGYADCPECGWSMPPAARQCSMCGWEF